MTTWSLNSHWILISSHSWLWIPCSVTWHESSALVVNTLQLSIAPNIKLVASAAKKCSGRELFYCCLNIVVACRPTELIHYNTVIHTSIITIFTRHYFVKVWRLPYIHQEKNYCVSLQLLNEWVNPASQLNPIKLMILSNITFTWSRQSFDWNEFVSGTCISHELTTQSVPCQIYCHYPTGNGQGTG